MLKPTLQLFGWPVKIPDGDINIEQLNADMVERSGRKTVVCYTNAAGKSETYSVICSLEKHQDIVNRFRAHMKARNDKSCGASDASAATLG